TWSRSTNLPEVAFGPSLGHRSSRWRGGRFVPVCGPAQTQAFFQLLFVKLATDSQQLVFQPGNPSLFDGPLPGACRGEFGGHQEHGPLNRGVPDRGSERGPVRGRRVGQGGASPRRGCGWRLAAGILRIGHALGATPLALALRRFAGRGRLDLLPAIQGGGAPQPYRGFPGAVLPLFATLAGVHLEALELVRHDVFLAVQ